MTAPASPPTWSTWTQAASVISQRANLRRTLGIAAVVGTVFVSMNQLGAVMAGQVTIAVVLKAILTYVVPFGVSNFGILAATRRPRFVNAPPSRGAADKNEYA